MNRNLTACNSLLVGHLSNPVITRRLLCFLHEAAILEKLLYLMELFLFDSCLSVEKMKNES